MAYFTYILKCSDETLYTGITTDLERRIKQHNGEINGGAKYTLARKPVELFYFENFENRSDATKRELEIKKMKRKHKLELIKK
ncbi:MAG: GIY-YIG nuclease family protein [Candidatus Gracilibacteria bacterium]|nr:GIY-YIG nuclease family protein [Candidatus Gracilibacteria bacterium]